MTTNVMNDDHDVPGIDTKKQAKDGHVKTRAGVFGLRWGKACSVFSLSHD